jgi:hypothetical protein
MRVAPWMPEKFEFQQNYAGGQQAYEQAMQQTVQDWQGGQYGTKPREEAQVLIKQSTPQQGGFQGGIGGLLGLGGLAGNGNLQDRLKFLKDFQQGGGPRRPYDWDFGPQQPQSTQHGFNQFGEQLGGFEETLGGYGEQMGGFGETLGGYGEQISGFEEQLGGFGEQFSGMQEQFGGVGEDINEINEKLGGIEEGISTLKISKPQQKQNPYANMFNPFSFIGNWGGNRSRMSYR